MALRNSDSFLIRVVDMKIAVVGAGAMGSIYAGLMADGGVHEVWAIDVWQEHPDAISGDGLRARVEEVAEVWRQAGFEAKAFEDINQLIWDKFVCNVSFSAPCTVFDRTVGEMRADPESWNVSLNCGLEAWHVGQEKGIRFSFDDPIAHITGFAERLGEARPSMLLDHMAGRPSEIDVINGMVPVLADELELDAPYNEVVTAIVRARERRFVTGDTQ